MQIICLHNIIDERPDKFDKKCSRISKEEFSDFIEFCEEKGFYFCNFSTFWENRDNPKAILLSFDDGFLGVYKYALPILRKKNITALAFINPWPTSKKNTFHFLEIEMLFRLRTSHYDNAGIDIVKLMKDTKKKLKKCHPSERLKMRQELLDQHNIDLTEIHNSFNEEKYQLMSWDNIKELQGLGWAIGAHTLTHPPLAFLNENEKKYEILQSKKEIEEELNNDVDCFAYPYGDSFAFDEVDQNIVRENFKYGFSTIEEAIDEKRPWAISRIDYKKFKELINFNRSN